jgi:dienelactone hydrolase
VLRLDPGGAGARSANEYAMDAAAVESDVRAGLSFLRSRADVDARRLGLLGHGHRGSIVAGLGDEPGVEFIILLAPTALPGRLVLGREKELGALDAGASPAAASRARQDLLLAIAIIEAESDRVRVRQRLTAFFQNMSLQQRPVPTLLTLDQMLALAEAPGFRELARHDPAPLLRSLRDPALVLVPELDREVDPGSNLPELRAALAGNPNARIETLPGLNHRFQTATTGAPEEYEKLPETFAPAALERIAGWIRQSAIH